MLGGNVFGGDVEIVWRGCFFNDSEVYDGG